MTIVCLSLAHRFVPAEILEKLAVPAAELGEVLARLRAVPGVDEAVALSTCNRVEVYARAGLDLAAARLGGLAACDAVVLGAGSTGGLVARLLRQAGVGRLSVASRSQVRAAEVAAAVGGRPMRTRETRWSGRTVPALRHCRPERDPSLFMPTPAQGVSAVECRTDDPGTAARLRALDHAPTRVAAIAERGFLAALGAGCSAPVGAVAEVAAEAGAEAPVRLSGLIAAPDGSSVIRAQLTGAADGEALGRRLAQLLLEHGGAAMLGRTSHGRGQRPLVPDAALPFAYYH